MRALSVGVFVFILTMIIFYGMCAFITAVPNPMDWQPMGRFLFCLLGCSAGFLAGLGSATAYEESH
jgi:hypothetical protein